VRSADQPGQTVNVDVCFVPAVHDDQAKLPAVSGSSGHLVVERLETATEAPTWPGQVFADLTLDYTTAMAQYAAATRERLAPRWTSRTIITEEPSAWRTEYEIRRARYQVRERRKVEDQTWKASKAQWRATREAWHALDKAARTAQQDVFAAAEAAWKRCRVEYQATTAKRATENQAWHASIARVGRRSTTDATARSWIAIVIITDNCTRQCIGLPAFASGAHLTSKEVANALQLYLPPALAFLISDQGCHFRNKTLAQLAQDADFIHVPVYRHRPESNGIAERMVRTLKAGLRDASWQTREALEPLLIAFRQEYNDRPHQGLGIPGLSPNEFARRIWLM